MGVLRLAIVGDCVFERLACHLDVNIVMLKKKKLVQKKGDERPFLFLS